MHEVRPPARTRLLWTTGGALLVLLLGSLLRTPSDPRETHDGPRRQVPDPTPAAPARSLEVAADSMAPPHASSELSSSADSLCDESLWPRLGAELSEVRGGSVFLDSRAWQHRSLATRVGLASWVSKCRAAGAEVEIRASGDGRLLAQYDPERGYEPAD